MSVCAMPIVAAKQSGERSDNRHDEQGRWGLVEKLRAKACHHVDASRHHGSGMDEG